VIYDEKRGRASGVRVVDATTKEVIEFTARIIFVNASAINTNLILLNSTSSRFPNGLGNDHGLLGKYVAFHNYRGRISAIYEGDLDKTTDGRTHHGAYVPRFRNVKKQETDFLRGYACGFSGSRGNQADQQGFGESLKQNLDHPKLGPWRVGANIMGETIPKETNFVALDKDQKDDWGVPLLRIHVEHDANDEKMLKDFFNQFQEMFTKAGFKEIKTSDSGQAPGLDIHEMGGARMGLDPRSSMLNKWNQLHACQNVFVTDGACMTSTSTQNPSLTYMALTARAADYAMTQLKKGAL
jgi:choline dehydrogenase-like flavoprotein